MEKLTKKQEKFVHELLKGKSQREAYKASYNAKNMADATIDSNACRLLKNTKVAARLSQLRSKVVAKAEEQAIMSAVEVIKEIESIAKDDISNYIEFRTDKVFVGYDSEGAPVTDYRTIVVLKDSRDINTKNVSEVSLSPNGAFKFKTYGRDTALYKLLELYGEPVMAKAKLELAKERFEHDKAQDAKKDWEYG